jgi:HK97 family phage portal protein
MRSLLETFTAGLQRKEFINYGPIDDLWRQLFGGYTSNSGPTVTTDNALSVTTVLACTRRIAEALMVSCKVYQRDTKTGQRREAREHALYDVLGTAPNEDQTGIEYREVIGFHTALTGGHFSYINRVDGAISELIPINPGDVKVTKDKITSATVFEIKVGGRTEKFSREEIWHVKGPSWNSTVALDAVKLLREAIGLALATEETHARLHSNGAQPGGLISFKQKLDDKQIKRMKEGLAAHTGLSSKFKTMILDNEATWQSMAMSGVDAQHLQTRYWQVEEICRGMGVMPIMVGFSGDKAPTYASAEQLFLAHLVHTVRPWHDRVKMSATRWLLTKQERAQGYYVDFVENAFLSPAMKDKAEYFKIGLGGGGNPGWIKPVEVRRMEDMDSSDDLEGLFVPAGMQVMDADGKPIQPPPPPAPPAAPAKPVLTPDPAKPAKSEDVIALEAQIQELRHEVARRDVETSAADMIVEGLKTAMLDMPRPQINLPAPVVKIPEVRADLVEVTRVTKHDEHGRIIEYERHTIESPKK